jgi:hypothetical protein
MEIKGAIHKLRVGARLYLCGLIILLSAHIPILAQPAPASYTIKDGQMTITLWRDIRENFLDSFINKYELYDLDLKNFVKTGQRDSLLKLGWNVSQNQNISVISKRLGSYNQSDNPADKIIFAEKQPTLAGLFPVVSSQVTYGFNRFRNKNPFLTRDSIVRFFLRGNTKAARVVLSGSFSKWSTQALGMTKTDSGWIKDVALKPGKYWYKFIVDGNWTTDRDNQLSENDGMGNDNSVFYRTNTVFRLRGHNNARRVYISGSFNDWRERDLQMTETATGWELPLYLANGTHTYRFIVDGKWMADPENSQRYPNEFNDFNSVVRIGKPYVFRLDGYENAKSVFLSGSFNGWRKEELAMTRTANGWELHYTLGPGNYEYNFIVDGKVARPAGGSRNLFFVIEPNYTFRLKGFANAKTVYLAGDFNNWAPNTFSMTHDGTDWVTTVHISPGKHLYKYVVDGNWIIDPGNKLWEQNEHNTGNSVLWVE